MNDSSHGLNHNFNNYQLILYVAKQMHIISTAGDRLALTMEFCFEEERSDDC